MDVACEKEVGSGTSELWRSLIEMVSSRIKCFAPVHGI
jgi:hypothetical protein